MQDENDKECKDASPAIDQIISGVDDAISRADDMRARLAKRNDRLFGCVPCEVKEAKQDTEDGSINKLHHNINKLHQSMDLLGKEITRQSGLA